MRSIAREPLSSRGCPGVISRTHSWSIASGGSTTVSICLDVSKGSGAVARTRTKYASSGSTGASANSNHSIRPRASVDE
jgi:hypothetical protein